MNKLKGPFSIFLTVGIIFFSCSSEKMEYLSINCVCAFSEHYGYTTNKSESQIKEFSFVNSRLFTMGVPQESFATSSAILINKKWDLDSAAIIQIKLVDKTGNNEEHTSFDYSPSELDNLSSKYFQIMDLASVFVEGIYSKKYDQCSTMVIHDLERDKFIAVLNEVRSGLEEKYLDTRIVSYEAINDEYQIFGGVNTAKGLDLFKMNLKDTNQGLKIVSFSF